MLSRPCSYARAHFMLTCRFERTLIFCAFSILHFFISLFFFVFLVCTVFPSNKKADGKETRHPFVLWKKTEIETLF